MATSLFPLIPIGFRQVQAGYGWHMGGGPGTMMGYGYGWGGWGIVHAVFWLVTLLAIIVIALTLVRRPGSGDADGKDTPPPTALEILDERYARGEIDREDYLQRKKDISGA